MTKRRAQTIVVLVGTTGVAALATALLPRIPQPQWYHHFADTRKFLNIPNAANVLSNVGFLVVGVPAMVLLLRRQPHARFVTPDEKWPYLAFFTSIALTAIGSSYYHLAPDNDRLFSDRLPIAFAAGAIVAAAFSDRLGPKAGNRLLLPLLGLGAASTLHWIYSEHLGKGDLRFYGFMQSYPVLIIPALVLATHDRYTRTTDLAIAGGLYGLAKVCEFLDKPIFLLGKVISGHTLKHLFAAAAAYVIARMLMKREIVTDTEKRPLAQSASSSKPFTR